MTQVTFRILGRLEALVDGRRVELSSRRERALLGVLVLKVGEVVSVDALIDSVWGERAPASARHMVHEYVSRLRAAFGDAPLIATREPGYIVERDACELDADRFAELVRAARAAVAADELDEALKAFDEALGLWRGEALGDLALEGDARSAAARLDDQRRAAGAERVDVALALGRHHELIADLERTVAAEPLDEHVLGQLMLALYRDGRQADALARYREGRQRLVRELGIEPGAELRALEQAILRQDPELTRPMPDAAPARESRSPPRRRRLGLAVTIAAVAAAASAVIAATLAKSHAGANARVHGNAIAVVDAATSRLVGSLSVDSRPAAIAYGAGSLWVSSPDARSVLRISPASRRVIASVPLAVAAQSLAASAGKVWAVGSRPTDTSLTLERINPTFNTATRVRRLPMIVAGDSGSIAGRRDSVVVAPRSGFLTRIDPRSGRPLARVDPAAAPTAVAQGFGSSWLAYPEANLVVRVDATGAITPIPVGRRPSAITAGKRAVWVANTLDGTVKSIDPATSSVITTVKVGTAPAAIAEGDGSIWVANAGDGTLTRIDERTSRPSPQLDVGGSPQALVVANGKVWVTIEPATRAAPSGGTLLVSVPSTATLFDPAWANSSATQQVHYAICSSLLNYPDEPAPAGLRLVPDAARAAPTVSDGGRSYTFVIRRGLRFSPPSNELITAQTFKHTIERSLSPRLSRGHVGPPGQFELGDVVGAAAYIGGKTRHIAGVTARGDRLTIRLTHPAPDLPARLATELFCAVPSDMPLTLVRTAFPSAGPYYIAAATPGRSLVLLRNPNYHGDRPRRPKRIEVVVGPAHPAVAEVEASHLDYAFDAVPADQSALLERLYGARSPAARRGRQRYFVNSMLEVDMVRLNTSRPLFASARMRRAVNYAVDRRALAKDGGTWSVHANVAQMYLPPGVPGFRDEHVYPLVPDFAKARRLAGGGRHTAVLYCLFDGGSPRAARIIANNLARIGIDVRVHCMPGDAFYTRMLDPNDPWDMVIDGWAGLDDPGEFLNGFARRDAFNASHLDDSRIDALINDAARRSGLARAFAYARVDHTLVRDAAPWIAFANENKHDFFSARIGCQLYQPLNGMDLGALCIRPGHAADAKPSVS
jgi:YVTN family beta-propeller protein